MPRGWTRGNWRNDPLPSTLSLLGLLRHLAKPERDWRNWISQGEPEGRIYGPPGSEFDIERPDQRPGSPKRLWCLSRAVGHRP